MSIGLQQPKRTRGKPTEDGDFVVFENVAVFDEHVGDDGVEYDERMLQQIAANCNRRIQTTGDYCPIVVGHTRDNDEKRSVTDDPPVVGLAGPFYVADFVNHKGEQSKAIHATFWVFPEEEQTFLRNPRRSVEIWPEERPEQRFFDPISLLGAETPKRDLGLIYARGYSVPGPLRYSKRTHGKPPLKYQEGGGDGGSGIVTTPGPHNAFIPGAVDIKKKKKKHAKGDDDMALGPDDIQQIIDALKPTIQALIDNATANVDEGGINVDNDNDVGEGLNEPVAAETPIAPVPPPTGDMPTPPAAVPTAPVGPLAGGDINPNGDDDDADNDGDVDEDDLHPDKMSDEDKLYARGLGRKFMKYAKDGKEDDFLGGLDDDDKKTLRSYMKYMCDDKESKERYAAKCGSCGGSTMDSGEMKPGEPERYGKPSDNVSPTKAKQILEDGEIRGKPLTKAQEGMFGTAAGNADKYSKLRQERDSLAKKYHKMQVVNEELKATCKAQEEELSKTRQAEKYAKRHSRIKDKELEGYVLDAEEEMALTSDYTDEQFDRHCDEIIPSRYSKTGAFPNVGQNIETSHVRLGMDEKSQKYAKAAADCVMKYRKSGKKIDFPAVLKHMIDNDTANVDESKLFAMNGNGKSH